MRPELTFVRVTRSWRFWAFGWHTQQTRVYRHTILTLGFGPLRFQFLRIDRDR